MNIGRQSHAFLIPENITCTSDCRSYFAGINIEKVMWSSDMGFILQHVLNHLQREVPVKCGWPEEWFGRGLKY